MPSPTRQRVFWNASGETRSAPGPRRRRRPASAEPSLPPERSPLIRPRDNKGGHCRHAHFTERKPQTKYGPGRSGQPSGPGSPPCLGGPSPAPSFPALSLLPATGRRARSPTRGPPPPPIPLHRDAGRARGAALSAGSGDAWLCPGSPQIGRGSGTPQPLTSVPLSSRDGAGG